jgi:pyruvate,water dikinase
MSNVLTLANTEGQQTGKLGGKGFQLLQLNRQGYTVPSWFVVSTEVFDRVCSHNRYRQTIRAVIQDTDLDDLLAVDRAADELQRLFLTATIDKAALQEILEAYLHCFSPEEYVAVRSSAAAEDAEAHSFAGQLDSFLFVKGEQGLIEAIKRCWASAFSPRALLYQHLHGLDPSQTHMAVIVQRMVPAEVSGIMFTADPVSGREDTLVITATLGLGVALVSGATRGDTYWVTKQTGAVAEDIPLKERMVVLDEDRGVGTMERKVPLEQRDRPCLRPHQVQELAQAGRRIEQHYKKPQDIEWAIAGDRIYILQTRPITALERIGKSQRIVWDNSNIIESYPGVTSPLTYSFAREAYSVVYRQTAELVGVPRKAIAAHQETFSNMIGLIRGRIYYNLNSWYRGLTLVPGFEYNKAFMEGMMGVRESLDWQEDPGSSRSFPRSLLGLPSLVLLASRMLYYTLTAHRHTRSFQLLVDTVCSEYERKKLRYLEPPELVTCYRDLQQRLLQNWKAPIINDFLTALFYGVLRLLITRYKLDEGGALQNDLLCGEGGIPTTEPAKAIMRMAATVKEDPELAALFESTSDQDLCQLLLDGPEHPALATQLRDYLDRYGFRYSQELKLEKPSLKDDPAPLFTAIRNYSSRQELNIETMEARQQEIRKRAEEQVRQKLRGRLPWPAPRYLLFRWVLRRARSHVKSRENMRFSRTRVFGIVRELFKAIGETLHRSGLLDDPQDVFYLEVEEIVGFVKGTTTSANLRGLVRLREQEFQDYREEEPPADRFETTGMVWHGNDFVDTRLALEGDDVLVLQGLGCCPGVVKGLARVVSSPHDHSLLQGEILVAKETDPGWISLFPLASGLLIERGSMLSHSAIVARELGIPTIVGISGLTHKIHTGQLLAMDGASGMVTIVER